MMTGSAASDSRFQLPSTTPPTTPTTTPRTSPTSASFSVSQVWIHSVPSPASIHTRAATAAGLLIHFPPLHVIASTCQSASGTRTAIVRSITSRARTLRARARRRASKASPASVAERVGAGAPGASGSGTPVLAEHALHLAPQDLPDAALEVAEARLEAGPVVVPRPGQVD